MKRICLSGKEKSYERTELRWDVEWVLQRARFMTGCRFTDPKTKTPLHIHIHIQQHTSIYCSSLHHGQPHQFAQMELVLSALSLKLTHLYTTQAHIHTLTLNTHTIVTVNNNGVRSGYFFIVICRVTLAFTNNQESSTLDWG